MSLKPAELCKLLTKFPRIVEYRAEKTLRPRMDFFLRHGVKQEDIAKVPSSSSINRHSISSQLPQSWDSLRFQLVLRRTHAPSAASRTHGESSGPVPSG